LDLTNKVINNIHAAEFNEDIASAPLRPLKSGICGEVIFFKYFGQIQFCQQVMNNL